ncbi:MAG: 50S ribosomal protein L29, partial [Candidatus Aenigmarchaeota archaeon]|nr:50S ribosomal protein L29 [Candidatus Aenigmarchaeota archaeon]
AQVHAGGSVKNPGRIRELRRTIARILTIMRERKETQ